VESRILEFYGYVTSREFGPYYMPVSAQNSCLREYAAKRAGKFILPPLESAFPNCFHQLFGIAQSSRHSSCILMYSVLMLPTGEKLKRLIQLASARELRFAFVLENIFDSANSLSLSGALDSYALKALSSSLDRIPYE
jgi:sporadic carbohydrate cluster protein (TIGR04323 family)